MPKSNEDVTDLDEINEAVIDEDESTVDEEAEEIERARARGDYVEEDEDDGVSEEEETDEEEETEEEEDLEGEDEDGDNRSEGERSGSDEDGETSDDKGDEPRIPKSRLDKVIGQREAYREAFEKVEERESQYLKIIEGLQKVPVKDEPAETKPAFDMEAKEAEALDAILEGDSKAYTAVRKEINDYILSEAKASNAGLDESVTKAARQEAMKLDDESRFQKAVTDFSEKYTFLNGNSDDFNDEALAEVDKLFNKFVGAGDNKTDALTEAIGLIAPRYTTTKSDLSELGEAKAKRRTKAVKKAARATKQQPPESKGKQTKQIEEFSYENLVDMTEKDWEKLPAAIKKKLRGD